MLLKNRSHSWKIKQRAQSALCAYRVERTAILGELSVRQKVIRTVIALAIAFVSMFPVASVASSPDSYQGIIATLGEKKANVTAMATIAAGASIAVSVLPEVANEIAANLADLSSDFFMIVAVLLLEKYLLTLFGLAAFRILIPLACAAYIFGLWVPRYGFAMAQVYKKLALLGLALVCIVPTSTFLMNQIDQIYQQSVAVKQLVEGTAPEEERTGGGLLDSITSIPSNNADGAMDAATAAADQFNLLMERFAVMFVTSCIIPLLVLMGFLWLVKVVLGVNMDGVSRFAKERSWRRLGRKLQKRDAIEVERVRRFDSGSGEA